MTDHQKAVKYARATEWRKANVASSRKAAREWYRRNKTKANNASWRYDQEHYQERLAYFRERTRKMNDATRKIPYKARPSRRVPDFAMNAAHVRAIRRDLEPITIGEAYENGMTCKRRGGCQ